MPVGNIEVFDPATGDWKLYIERLEQYFLINDVKEYLKVPTLIALMGGISYELLATLCAPQKPTTMTFEDVVQTMSDYLYPKPCILAQRYNFKQRKQHNGEKILEYVADLKKLAMKCEFKTNLDENLRDQLVCGIRCETTRKQLFAEDTLDFRTALAIALNLEAGERTTSDSNKDDEALTSCPEFKKTFAVTLKLEASEGSSSKSYNDDEVSMSGFDFEGGLAISHESQKSAGLDNDCEIELSLSDSNNDLAKASELKVSGRSIRECYYEAEVPMSHSDESEAEDEGTPKYRRGKSKLWIYSKKFISLKKAEEFLDVENTWSRNFTRNTVDGPKRYYRCNKVKKRGPQCAAELYLLFDKHSDDIFVYRTETDHNHDEIGIHDDLGIADLTKIMIHSLVDRRLKPKAILQALGEMEGIKLPTKTQLNNYLAVLKRAKIEKGNSEYVSGK